MRTNTDAGSGPHDSENCACRKKDNHWRVMCVAAQAAHDALHAEALADYRRTVRTPGQAAFTSKEVW